MARPPIELATVAAGGALGASIRWAVGLVLPAAWALVLVNLVGAAVLAALHDRDLGPRGPAVRTGVLGALTSVSAMAVLALDGPVQAVAMLGLLVAGAAVAEVVLGRSSAARAGVAHGDPVRGDPEDDRRGGARR